MYLFRLLVAIAAASGRLTGYGAALQLAADEVRFIAVGSGGGSTASPTHLRNPSRDDSGDDARIIIHRGGKSPVEG